MFQHPVVIVKHERTPAERYIQTFDNFSNKQVCEGAVNALQYLESKPVHVAIIESDLPDMSGVDLAEAIRDIDSESGHFTYIILVGGNLSSETEAAYEQVIDVFVNEEDARILKLAAQAGIRIAERINGLNDRNEALIAEREQLLRGQLVDPLTGLGNRRFAEQSLVDAIRQIESRGGAACFVIIAIDNYDAVLEKFDATIAGELMIAVADRIRNLVRPMDIATCFSRNSFALVLLQPTIENCTAECYERIFDGVRLKSYKTSIGFQNANIAMSLCASHADNGAPSPDRMIQTAEGNLKQALISQKIHVEHLTE